MHSISDYNQIIEDEIKCISLPGSPASLYEPVTYMLGLGGKRIRPVLTLIANEMFEGNIRNAIKPALAMEMFHNFTLVHDDIMDHSAMRRGNPTVHEKWNEETAILSGDVMLVIAYELLSAASPEKLPTVFNLFSHTAKALCEGQQLDMIYENADTVSLEQYIEMIGKKTAALFAGSLKMGALLAGCGEEDAENLYGFGHYAGLAFQVQDDILDTYGEEGQWGKIKGGDIASNKKTFLAITALELAESDVLNKLKNLANLDHKSKIQQTISIFNSLSIKKKAEQARDTYFNTALQFLDKINAKEEGKQILKEVAGTFINRER